MSFLITRRPQKLFTGSAKFSRWTGIHNPYNFEFTRQDYGVFNVLIRPSYSSTLPTIYTDGDPATLPTFVSAGDQIYLNSGVYNGVYTVDSVNGQYITIDTPFIGNGNAGRVNLIDRLQNFKAFINIYDGVTDALIESVYPKPDSTGFLIYDVSGVIRSLLNTQAEANQSVINVANDGISGSFKIGYGATYKFVSPSVTIDVTIPETIDPSVYYWLSAAKQIDGNTSDGIDGIGQNLKDHVPKNLNGSEAKFLTMFETPTYFEGFPFTLSFLYDEDFETVYLDRHQQDLNINGVNIGSETDNTLNVNGRGYVNQMLIRTPNTGADSFDVWLEVGDEITGGGYVEMGGIERGAADRFAVPFGG